MEIAALSAAAGAAPGCVVCINTTTGDCDGIEVDNSSTNNYTAAPRQDGGVQGGTEDAGPKADAAVPDSRDAGQPAAPDATRPQQPDAGQHRPDAAGTAPDAACEAARPPKPEVTGSDFDNDAHRLTVDFTIGDIDDCQKPLVARILTFRSLNSGNGSIECREGFSAESIAINSSGVATLTTTVENNASVDGFQVVVTNAQGATNTSDIQQRRVTDCMPQG
ncbi:hypothetical protein HYV58_00585 [Candidatus Peregrinibacteria bacterium]|nr:hypothetical protein [Candidatus Peregrinibacteria bacterium]